MSLYDFYMYLKYIEFSSENLEFYIWFKNYEESYNEGFACGSDKDEALVHVKTASESGSVSSSVFQKGPYHPSDGEGDRDFENGMLNRSCQTNVILPPHSASCESTASTGRWFQSSNNKQQQPQQQEIPCTASPC